MKQLPVLAENADWLVLNKPSGIPATADKTGAPSLLEIAEQLYGHRLHPVHRIDRPVSGIFLLAKTTVAMAGLSAQFQARTVEKTYLAIVQNPPPAAYGTLRHYLKKQSGSNRVSVSETALAGAERAELKYTLLNSGERYHLLQIQLITGRRHQIRAQLAAIGCPVKGDVKYGARRGNPDRSIHLHAWRLAFSDPMTDEKVQLEAPLPDDVLWNALGK
ncbi:MAG: RNA pseudouridine synthase [Saprospiraceae bacterium]|nr:RNA pseudouridine synthase [Saprospiraceae bacterium]